MKQKWIWQALLFGCCFLTANVWGNGRISFTGDTSGNLDIYLINTNGENLVNLTNHPADDYSPTWAPDGTAFAYVSEQDGNPEIYVMDIQTRESRRLTDHRATDIDPAWSPDGRWLAFASNQARDHAADTDIYIMDVRGKKVQRLTNKGGHNSTPAWSPDGEWIAFRSTQDGIGGIHIMNTAGGKQRALTQVAATNPSWTSDGKHIYFSSDKLDGVGRPTLFVVDVDGDNPRKLIDALQACEEPAASPDGRWIAYTSDKDIYLISTAGGEPRQLTQTPGEEFSPAWVPSAFPVSPHGNMQTTLWGMLKRVTSVSQISTVSPGQQEEQLLDSAQSSDTELH